MHPGNGHGERKCCLQGAPPGGASGNHTQEVSSASCPSSWNVPCVLVLCQPSAGWGCKWQVAEARPGALGF